LMVKVMGIAHPTKKAFLSKEMP